MQDALEVRTRDFLARWGIDMDTLIRHAPPVGDGECLAIMGSIVEGLANDESDIDLLYLGSGELTDKLVITFDSAYRLGVSHDENGYEINVEQLTTTDLDRLASGLESSLRTVYDPKNAKGVHVERDINKLRMIHRIGNSVALANPHVLEAWQEKIRTSELHVFLCQNNVESLLNQQEDILGELDAGEFQSAVWMAKTRYVPTLIAAMLTSVGETNLQAKWHYKLLRRYEAELGAARVQAVLDFVFDETIAEGQDLAGRLIALSEPILNEIYQRQRAVRRSVLAFSHTVRYNELKNPKRWTRIVAAT